MVVDPSSSPVSDPCSSEFGEVLSKVFVEILVTDLSDVDDSRNSFEGTLFVRE